MTNPVELLFQDTPAVDGGLVFKPEGVGGTTNATIAGSFAPLGVAIAAGPVEFATITGSFEALAITATAAYSSNTDRPTVGQTSARHQDATKSQDGATQPQQDARNAPVGWAAFWQKAIGAPAGVEHVLPDVFQASPVERTIGHQDAARLHDSTVGRHQAAARIDQQRTGLFQNATGTRNDTLFKHQDGDRTKRAGRVSGWLDAAGLLAARGSDFQTAAPLSKAWLALFQEGVPPPPGLSVYSPPIDPPLPSCYTPDPDLVFSWPSRYSGTNLVFVCGDYTPPPQGQVVVPVRKVYFMSNTVFMRRVSDDALIPAFSVSLSLDVSSWSWGFSASLPGQAQSLVEPINGPVELKVSINGTEFRVLAESVARERTFGVTSIKVSGRGKNAALDAPYAPVQTFGGYGALTANQLLEQILTLNSIPLGWSIGFELDDWNVPAGVFNHQGTYVSALKAVAQSAGGYLLPHASNQSFTVKHLYPTLPWAWNTVTPNFTLPADVVTRESLEWVEKPSYNRVYVSGQANGRLGRVTRSGTAGDVLAPMVVDQLITDAVAARQRGEAILADTGKQIKVGLRLPVLAETGIIRPGHFVQYQEGSENMIGLVRGVSVDTDGVEAWQRLEVETHA